jgi:hypothetical protein
MNKIISPMLIILALYNLHCGSSSKIQDDLTTKDSVNIEIKRTVHQPAFYYSGIYCDNIGLRYINTKDSTNYILINLTNLLMCRHSLSPNNKYFAFNYEDSVNDRTDVYAFNLTDRKLIWLKNEPGFKGRNDVDLIWANDSLLYCNFVIFNKKNSGYERKERYTALINVNTNKTLKNFTPKKGQLLEQYIKDKYLLYLDYDSRLDNDGNLTGLPTEHLIDKDKNRIIKTYGDKEYYPAIIVSPNGDKFISRPFRIGKDENGNEVSNEKIVVNNIDGSEKETINQSSRTVKNIQWAPNSNIISFIRAEEKLSNEINQKEYIINYLYLYDVKNKQLSQLVNSDYDYFGRSTMKYDYTNYRWSPSGKYMYIERKAIGIYNTKEESYFRDCETEEKYNLPIEGFNVKEWWEDNLILLGNGYNYKIYNMRNQTYITPPEHDDAYYYYLKEEK